MTTNSSIMEFLFHYALDHRCGGNMRFLARLMQTDHQNVYKWNKRFHEGRLSAVAMEALLKMYAREELGLDAALHAYHKHVEELDGQSNGHGFVCMHSAYAQKVYSYYEALEIAKPKTDAKHTLACLARDLMEMIEKLFCEGPKTRGEICYFQAIKSDICPCRNLGILTDRLMRAMDDNLLGGDKKPHVARRQGLSIAPSKTDTNAK